jgi:hypothetical protein
MAQPTFHNINDFLGQIRKTDFARSSRFEALFLAPSFMREHRTSQGDSPKIISMMVEDAMFPGILVGTRPLRINNLNEQRANAIDFGGDSITFTFLCDTSWTAKDFFGDWMRKIVNPYSRYVSYPDDYYSEIDLVSLNNEDEVIAHWRIHEAFPRSIAPITVSATNSEVLRLPVTFAYKRWEVISAYTPEGVEYSNLNELDNTDNADQFITDVESDIADIPQFEDI